MPKVTNRIDMRIYIPYLTFCVLVCVLLRFSCALLSQKLFFLDWLFHVSSFWTIWFQVGSGIVWFLLMGLCFGLGTVAGGVWRAPLHLTLPYFEVALLRISPNLCSSILFAHQFIFLFWWLFLGFVTLFLGGICCPKGHFSARKRPFYGHRVVSSVLWVCFLFFLCCYALVPANVLWQVFSCALVVHQSYFCGVLIVFPWLLFFTSGSLQFCTILTETITSE